MKEETPKGEDFKLQNAIKERDYKIIELES